MISVELQVFNIHTTTCMKQIYNLYQAHPPLVAAFDTEGSGLSIIEDKPFLFQFGWYNLDIDTIYVGLIDLEYNEDGLKCIKQWHTLVSQAPLYLAHNIKFDLHMIENVGVPYTHNNISDTLFYIRVAHDNIPTDKGGVRLGLKEYCAKYIDPSAKLHDKKIQVERSAIAKRYNNQLKEMLGWRLKDVDEFFKDATNTSEDFPTVQDYVTYTEWLACLPTEIKNFRGRLSRNDIPYNLVSRETMYEYAAYDIVWVIKIYLQTQPVIEARGTQPGLDLENEYIRVAYKIERQGFDIDREYVTKSFHRMKKYIRLRRQELKDLTQLDITANQHKVLLEYFQDNGIRIESTGADVLKRVVIDYTGNPAVQVVNLILNPYSG